VLACVLVFIRVVIWSWCGLRLRLCRYMLQCLGPRAALVCVRVVAFVCALVVV